MASQDSRKHELLFFVSSANIEASTATFTTCSSATMAHARAYELFRTSLQTEVSGRTSRGVETFATAAGARVWEATVESPLSCPACEDAAPEEDMLKAPSAGTSAESSECHCCAAHWKGSKESSSESSASTSDEPPTSALSKSEDLHGQSERAEEASELV